MSKIVILGCGAVGRYMAIDLCKDPGCEVISVDVNQEGLERTRNRYTGQDIATMIAA